MMQMDDVAGPNPDARERLFEEAVQAYLEQRESGHPDKSNLLARYEAVAAELETFFAAQEAVGAVLLYAPTRLNQAITPGGVVVAQVQRHSEPFARFANFPPELTANEQYEMVRELGRGGMGVVYLAKNKLMNRLEVLKVINETLLDHPGAIERFLREIRSAAKLNHANVVTAYSAMQQGELLAFAMEYVEGQDLASLVKSRGPLPILHACHYVQQAASGLEHAFEKGMVHRDIKPQNLILAREGKKHIIKVLDFGLAKAAREKTEDTRLTGEGTMLGTPDYIAPEQALDAAKADIRADIYSLGCTLYCLLAGRPPFSAGSLGAILMAHQSQEARPLNIVRPGVPKELAAVVHKMMAKSPAERYQTPLEVVQALTWFVKQSSGAEGGGSGDAEDTPLDFLQTPTESKPAAGRSGRWKWGVPVALLFPVLLLALTELTGVTRWLRNQQPTPDPSKSGAPNYMDKQPAAPAPEQFAACPLDALDPGMIPPEERFDWQPKELVAVLGEHQQRHWGTVTSVAFSPDGKYLVSGGYYDYLRVWEAATMKEVAVHKLPAAAVGVGSIAFHPDGKMIAAVGHRSGICYLCEFDRGQLKDAGELRSDGDAIVRAAFAPGGKSLAAGCQNGVILRWDLNNRKVAPVKAIGHTEAIHALAFSPDGKLMASAGDNMVRLWDVSEGKPKPSQILKEQMEGVSAVAFCSNGHILVTGCPEITYFWDIRGKEPKKMLESKGVGGRVTSSANGDIVAASWNWLVRFWKVEKGQIQEWKMISTPTPEVFAIEFSPNGQMFASAGNSGIVSMWDVSGETPKETHPVKLDKHYYLQWFPRADISSDGRLLVCAAYDHPVQIWEMGGPIPKKKRLDALSSNSLELSPMNGWLAFDDNGRNRVLLTKLNGPEERSFEVLSNAAGTTRIAFSQNGRVLAHSGGNFANPARIGVWDTSGAHPKEKALLQAEGEVWRLAVSADGMLVAAIKSPTTEVQLWDISQAKPQPLPALKHERGVTSLAFAPKGKLLACGSSRFTQLWDLSGPEPKVQAKFLMSGSGISVSFSPAGDRLVVATNTGKLIVWDVSTEKEWWQCQLPGFADKVRITPDGRHVVTVNSNGTIYILRLKDREGKKYTP
jgi:serine/threonine protein kinase/WD40 repeat protein